MCSVGRAGGSALLTLPLSSVFPSHPPDLCHGLFWELLKSLESPVKHSCPSLNRSSCFSPPAAGLLQSRFASVLSQAPGAAVADAKGPRTVDGAPCAAPWSPLASAFAVPAAVPEAQVRAVGARRQRGLVPLERSITYGKGKLLMDMGLFMGRSFRVGWGPNWTLLNSGDRLSGAGEAEEAQLEPVEYGFLPTPVAPKS